MGNITKNRFLSNFGMGWADSLRSDLGKKLKKEGHDSAQLLNVRE